MPRRACLLLGILLLATGCGVTLGEVFQRSPCEARVEGRFFGSTSIWSPTDLNLEMTGKSPADDSSTTAYQYFSMAVSPGSGRSFSRCVPPGTLQLRGIAVNGDRLDLWEAPFDVQIEAGKTHYIGDVYAKRALPPEALRCAFTGKEDFEPHGDESALGLIALQVLHDITHRPTDYTLGVLHDPAYQSRKEFPVVPVSLFSPVVDPRIQCTFPTDLLLQPTYDLSGLDRF